MVAHLIEIDLASDIVGEHKQNAKYYAYVKAKSIENKWATLYHDIF